MIHCLLHTIFLSSFILLLALKLVNVGATQEVLSLCLHGRPKHLHYVSTIGVFCPLQGEELSEDSHPAADR